MGLRKLKEIINIKAEMYEIYNIRNKKIFGLLLVCFGAIPSSVQVLLLALCSRKTPGSDQGAIWSL